MPSPWTRRLRWVAMQFARRLHPEVTTRIGSHRMTYTVRDHYIGPDLYLNRAWEPHLLRLLGSYDLEGGVAIDVGACFGTYTLVLSDLVGPGGRVLAVEAGAEQRRFLERNIAQNGITNVEVVPVALGAREETREFGRDPLNFGSGRFTAGGGSEKVTVRPLDALTAGLAAGSIRYIKIDVEGAELEVLEGMRDTLRRNGEAIVQLELTPVSSGGRPVETVELLDELGLHGWEVARDRIQPIQPSRCYEWPRFRDIADLVVSRDAARLEERLLSSVLFS